MENITMKTPPYIVLIAMVAILGVSFLGPVAFSGQGSSLQFSVVYAQSTPQASATGSATTPAAGTTGTQAVVPSTCSIGIMTGVDWNFTDCILIPMMSWLGSWFLTIGGFFLVLAGVLFDWLVGTVIINFAGTLNTMGATTAITTGWTVFRDLSNIVIIGMFTFIAIATILGNTEYGYKKMLSRVLIVAVLINFSLLFAKIIIDTGNFTAYQVYQTIATSPQFAASQTPTQAGGAPGQFDIASAFLRPMGITSIWNTQGVLQQFGQTANSGMQAFGLGLVGGLLLMMLALVLLYGCFLIASRAILLIILMVTASIAFASHLHPTLSDSEYGWKGWWKSLLNASLFAPLLMVFLAISLLIIKGASGIVISQGTQQGAIGAAVFNALTSPTQAAAGNGWTVIMLYIFGIGLLFASFKLSSSFASTIGGFNLSQAILSTPIAALNRFAVAPALQNWRGRRNLENAEKAGKEAKENRAHADATGNFRPLVDSLRKQETYQNRAKRTYNFLNTGVGKVIGEATGVPKGLLKETKANFADTSKEIAEKAAKQASGLALSDTEKDKIRKEAYDQKMENKDQSKRSLEQQHEKERRELDIAEKAAKEQTSAAQDEKKMHQQRLETEEKTQNDIKTKHESIMRTIAEEIGKHPEGTAEHEGAKQRYETAKMTRDSEMHTQDEKIKTVRQEIAAPIAELDKKIREINASTETLRKGVEETKKNLDSFDTRYEKDAQEYAKNAVDTATARATETAATAGGMLAQNYLQRKLGLAPSKVTSDKARELTRKKIGGKRLKDIADLIKEEGGDEKKDETKH
jgi:hypothetical protein